MANNYKLLSRLYWLYVCLLVSSTSLTMAQTGQAPVIQWQRLLGPGPGFLQVTRAPDNGYAICYQGVLRISESGSTLWQSTIPESPEFPGYPNTPTFISATSDGGFAVLTYNQFKWSLARLNADGVVLWIKSFADRPSSASLQFRTFTNLISTADGGYLVTANTGYPRNGSGTEVYKFDAAGNNTLNRTINIRNPNDPRPVANASRVIQTSDGNYLLVGAASDPVVVTFSPMPWVIKIDQQLNTIWEKFMAGKGLYDVIISPYANDAAIAVGSINGTETSSFLISANGDITSGATLSDRVAGTTSFLVSSTNAASHTIVDLVNERNGDFRLQNVVGQNLGFLQKIGGSDEETITSVVASNDGGYLLVGTTKSTDGDVQGKTTNDRSAWMVKLSPVLFTGDIYSVRSGNWNDPSVWSCNCIPAANNNVIVKPTHVVVLDSTMPGALCQNLEIIGTFSMQGGSILVNGVQVAIDADNIITR